MLPPDPKPDIPPATDEPELDEEDFEQGEEDDEEGGDEDEIGDEEEGAGGRAA
jgi:hypothetical protein